MSDNIMVSVLCAAYNHEKYIRQALESFVNQKTDFRFEVLVNDDASTDGTADIIRQMAEEYPDIIRATLQTENQHSKKVAITNMLAEKARGKYIAICEGDDYWSDMDKLQTQVDWMEDHPDYSACVHNTMMLDCISGHERPYNERYSEDRDLLFEDVLYGVGKVYHTSATFGRSELFRDLPEFYFISARHRVGDHPRAIWYALNGKIRYMNKCMSVYRCFSTPTAWSNRMKDSDFIENRLIGAVEMYESLLTIISEDKREAAEKALLKYRWELFQARGEYAQMKKAPYHSIYSAAPLKQRLWISFKQYFPGLYCAYMKAQGREKEIPRKLRGK